MAMATETVCDWMNELEAADYIGMSVSFLRGGGLRGIIGNQTPRPPYYDLVTFIEGGSGRRVSADLRAAIEAA
jgi:hypothetical protein